MTHVLQELPCADTGPAVKRWEGPHTCSDFNWEFRLPVSFASSFDPSEPQFLLRNKGGLSLRTCCIWHGVLEFLTNCQYFSMKLQNLGARVIRPRMFREAWGRSLGCSLRWDREVKEVKLILSYQAAGAAKKERKGERDRERKENLRNWAHLATTEDK